MEDILNICKGHPITEDVFSLHYSVPGSGQSESRKIGTNLSQPLFRWIYLLTCPTGKYGNSFGINF